jgi:protein kinase A
MPFGKLLGRSKTKEEKESKHSNYQPVQYKQAGGSTSTKTSGTTSGNATAPVTSAPDPGVKSPANGDAPSDMATANLSNAPSGAVDSKGQPRTTKGKYTLTDFKIERTLGTGSFGRVHLVQSKHNQRYYAVKVLKKQQVVKMKQIEHTNDERKMLQRCKHPFLITLWGTFQDSKNLYMVMDFIEGGELFSLLRKSQVSEY